MKTSFSARAMPLSVTVEAKTGARHCRISKAFVNLASELTTNPLEFQNHLVTLTEGIRKFNLLAIPFRAAGSYGMVVPWSSLIYFVPAFDPAATAESRHVVLLGTERKRKNRS
jgi:hypothetical protein